MSLVVQQRFETVALLCAVCDTLWDAHVNDHPDLQKIEPFDNSIPIGRTDGDVTS